MDPSKWIDKGTECIKQAVEKDNNEEYEAALSLYVQGINYLMAVSKYNKNPTINTAVKEKIAKYLKRAEEMQVLLRDAKPKKKYKKQKQEEEKEEQIAMTKMAMMKTRYN